MTFHALLNMPFLAINPVIEPIGRVGLNKAQLSLHYKRSLKDLYIKRQFSASEIAKMLFNPKAEQAAKQAFH